MVMTMRLMRAITQSMRPSLKSTRLMSMTMLLPLRRTLSMSTMRKLQLKLVLIPRLLHLLSPQQMFFWKWPMP